MSDQKVRVIEPWIWVDLADRLASGRDVLPFEREQDVNVQELTKNFFKSADIDFENNTDPDQLVAEMDAAGIERAIIAIDADDTSAYALAFAQKHPDRFSYQVGLKPTGSIREVSNLVGLANNHPVVSARITPFVTGLAPDHAHYFPAYVRCIDLDIPLLINTGVPGPMGPAACQDPLLLDAICLQFPELKVCMAHGAHPWWDMAIRLMQKHVNLHLMTTAYLPKYLPPELLQYMNTRGANKIIYGSDHPYLNFNRTLASARQLDLREGVLDAYLYQNAKNLFFGGE